MDLLSSLALIEGLFMLSCFWVCFFLFWQRWAAPRLTRQMFVEHLDTMWLLVDQCANIRRIVWQSERRCWPVVKAHNTQTGRNSSPQLFIFSICFVFVYSEVFVFQKERKNWLKNMTIEVVLFFLLLLF